MSARGRVEWFVAVAVTAAAVEIVVASHERLSHTKSQMGRMRSKGNEREAPGYYPTASTKFVTYQISQDLDCTIHTIIHRLVETWGPQRPDPSTLVQATKIPYLYDVRF